MQAEVIALRLLFLRLAFIIFRVVLVIINLLLLGAFVSFLSRLRRFVALYLHGVEDLCFEFLHRVLFCALLQFLNTILVLERDNGLQLKVEDIAGIVILTMTFLVTIIIVLSEERSAQRLVSRCVVEVG
jgi:hypothetical protein